MSNWKQYTDQEAFDLSAGHLLRQGSKSERYEAKGDWTYCAYRGDGGRMCAIGPFIPDDEVTEMMAASEVARECGFDRDLALSLRYVHDNCDIELWPCKLREVAEAHDLNADAVTR